MAIAFRGGPVPGVEIGFTLQAGEGSSGRSSLNMYLLAEYNASGAADGSAVSDRLSDQTEADAFCGAGSVGAWMFAHALKENPLGRIWVVPIVPLGAGTKATGTFTVTGTTSTAAGTIVVDLGGQLVSADYASGVSQNDVAIALEAAMDAWKAKGGIYSFPLVPSVATNVVTVTADAFGVEWNQFPIRVVSVTPGTAIVVTASGALMTGGVGAMETTLIPNALALITSIATPLLVCQHNESDGSTKAADLVLAHLLVKNNAQNMKWSAAYMAKSDTYSNLNDWADSIETDNGTDLRLIGWKGSRNAIPCMATAYAAKRSAVNQGNLRIPLNGVSMTTMTAPDAADQFTVGNQETLLFGGVCPGVANDGGKVSIVFLCTARTDLGVMPGQIPDILYQVGVWLREGFTPTEPQNIVPPGYPAYGPNNTTTDGARGKAVDVLYRAEGDPYGYLYGVEDGLPSMADPVYSAGGQVTITIPSQCLAIVPGWNNTMIEGIHEVDAITA